MAITLRPHSEGIRSATTSIIISKNDREYEFKGNLQHGRDSVSSRVKIIYENDKINDLTTKIESTFPILRNVDVHVKIYENENGMINLELNGVTPWKWIENIKASGNYL